MLQMQMGLSGQSQMRQTGRPFQMVQIISITKMEVVLEPILHTVVVQHIHGQ